MISLSALRERGWTRGMVDKLLGVPDGTAPNPRFRRAAPVRLYSLERVEAAEATEAYARLFEVGRARGKAAQRAAEARKATLLEAIAGMEVSVEKGHPPQNL